MITLINMAKILKQEKLAEKNSCTNIVEQTELNFKYPKILAK